MKKIFTLTITVLMCLTVTACSFFGGSKPENIAIKFTECAYNGDYDCVIDSLNISEQEKKDGSLALISSKLQSAVAKAKSEADRKGGVKEIVVDSKQIDEPNGVGKVKLTINFKNDGSQSKSETYNVIRTDNGWKVNL